MSLKKDRIVKSTKLSFIKVHLFVLFFAKFCQYALASDNVVL